MSRPLIARAAIILFLVAASAAADGWVIFKGQVNGPVKGPIKSDPASFAHKKYPGIYWSELYYHQMNFPDGSMITVQIGFNVKDSSIIFAYCKPGQKPFTEFLVGDVDDVRFEAKGFGFTMDKNRVWLAGNQYHIDLDFGRVQAKLVYDILSPGYTYGDGMVRYPDGKSFSYYTLPIPWARARGQATVAGKKYEVDGFGSMNHDNLVISPFSVPANWQCFWFYGADHALLVADYFTREDLGRVPVQRLVLVNKDGGMFTSTKFQLKWDNWVKAKDLPFRYPRHYTLSAEGQGAKLTVEVNCKELLLLEDLMSNLPSVLRAIAKQVTRNGYTVDYWSDYTLTYTMGGQTKTYKGKGIVRWTNLEEE